jgi:hypothetical protein
MPSNPLNHFLSEKGIRPASFAFFLSRYIKTRPAKKRIALSLLLTEQLRQQAELIEFHLRN